MRTFGSWQVECTLGVGGMGVVHRVRHAQTDALAALKTASSPGPHARRSLRREASALRQLSHAAIVRLIEDGTDEPEPWYVMQLLHGKPLSALLGVGLKSDEARTWTGPTLEILERQEARPEPLSRRTAPPNLQGTVRYGLARIAELCHALCHLHASGLVHCDLKPDNVLVVEDRSVLLDFGLVATRGPRIDRASILLDSRIAGTAAYMSPERVRGDPFDARADLYAVGCMIYRIIAGRPPFEGRSPMQVMAAHRDIDPMPLAERTKGVPSEISDLVSALLEKDPRARPGHAQRVLHVLAKSGVDVPDWPLPARAPLYQPALRGRERMLSAMTAAVERARAGSGGALWLVGESGSGKSRLLAALVGSFGMRGPRVLVGGASALPGSAGESFVPSSQPFGLFADILKEIAEGALTDQLLAESIAIPRRRLAPWLPSLAGGAVIEDSIGPDNASAAMHRLYSAVFDMLDASLGEDPALIMLDDLQWADDLSVGALSLLVRRIRERPWLIIGAMRAENDDQHLKDVLPYGERLQIERLGESHVRSIVCDMLGQPQCPEALLGWVERQASGNPLFVGECLRAAVSGGLLALSEEGQWTFSEHTLSAQPLPNEIGSLVLARLSSLSSRALAVARAAAVAGKVVDLPLLSGMTGETLEALEIPVFELSRRSVVEPEDERLAFVHDLLVETLYAAISPEDRLQLHRAAADTLQQRKQRDLGRIGWHRERAGQFDLAFSAYRQAAEHAFERLALQEADLRYTDALRVAPAAGIDQMTILDMRMRRNRHIWLSQGRIAASEAESAELLSLIAPDQRISARTVEILVDYAHALNRIRGPKEALERLSEAESIALHLADDLLWARVSSEIGTVLGHAGQPQEAARRHEAAIARIDKASHPEQRSIIKQRLAVSYNTLGRYEEALALLDEVIHEHVGSARILNEAVSRAARGNVLCYLCRFDEAIEEYRAALAIQRRAGNRHAQGVLLGNWASALVQQDRISEGTAQFKEALAIHREVGDLRLQGVALRSLAGMLVLDGLLEETLAATDEAEQVLSKIGDVLWIAHCDRLRAQAHRFLGHKEEAKRYTDRAAAAFRALNAPAELSDVLVYYIYNGIAFGEPYDAALDELYALAAGAPPGSKLDHSRERAEHLVKMHLAGEHMLAGEDPRDLPPPLQERIYAWAPRPTKTSTDPE